MKPNDFEASRCKLWWQALRCMRVKCVCESCTIASKQRLDSLITWFKLLRSDFHRFTPAHMYVRFQGKEAHHGEAESRSYDGYAKAGVPVDPLADAVQPRHAPVHLCLVEDVARQEVLHAVHNGMTDETKPSRKDHLLLVMPRQQLLPYTARLNSNACSTRKEVLHYFPVHPAAIHEHQGLTDHGQVK
eukprot:CAMPEP_0179191432 /NCGR_PEP_ID=MMETSP0796-20121207/95085_1 /TAXON_ID=73915 /ORGANISM="Pyrodinium bahamense, Strain pbaha01" /LENGTH=187 /DNA_ID=CAMNT_0020895659 /DNA_START=45 /DNA_END=608 /DNA_ORIENTATION=-